MDMGVVQEKVITDVIHFVLCEEVAVCGDLDTTSNMYDVEELIKVATSPSLPDPSPPVPPLS